MFTIVIDINCLLQIIPKRAPDRWLYDMILQGEVEVAISLEISMEYQEIIEQKTNATIADNIINTLTELPGTKNINPSYRWQLIHEDADDNKYVDCMIAANADFLISDDRHFNVLDTNDFPPVARIRLSQAKAALSTK